MKRTVFIKVDVKDRLPEIRGKYKILDTSEGRLWYISSVKKFSQSFDESTVELFKEVDWFLEEIKLPSEEEIANEAFLFNKFGHDYGVKDNYIKGAKYILNKITNTK